MNLALVGYGKMGRLLEQLAPGYGFTVTVILDEADNAHGEGITAARFQGVDAAIEFTTPESALANIEALARLRVPTVVGTTGWLAHLDQVKKTVQDHGSALVWAPNFSIGVNIFQRVVAEAARWMQRQREYEAWAWEIHHSAKKDAPSGTLLKLVDEMKKAGYEHRVDVASNRAGAIAGTHEIGFDSAADTLTLRHTARSREGFARGALEAARWIASRRGFHEFSDVLFGNQEG
jgi:4-hydroxy-tetrahydrodipicolinate reductase